MPIALEVSREMPQTVRQAPHRHEVPPNGQYRFKLASLCKLLIFTDLSKKKRGCVIIETFNMKGFDTLTWLSPDRYRGSATFTSSNPKKNRNRPHRPSEVLLSS